MSKIKVNSIEAATGSTITIPSGQTLDISSTTLTLPSTVVTTTGTQTLTNKTIGVSQLTGTLPVANGGTGLTSLGTASQVLRVNSGATALEFGSVSSDFVKLAETDASNVSSVSLNGYFTSSYDIYKIYIDGVYGSSNNQYTKITFNTTGSYTEETSGYYAVMGSYRYHVDDSHNAVFNSEENASSMPFLYTQTSASNSGSAELTLYNPMSTTYPKMITGSVILAHADYTGAAGFTGYWNGTSTAITGIRFKQNSGNIYARKIRLYGIKN